MKVPTITPNNLKKIGFKEVDRNGDVFYERGGLRITFGDVNGIDCIAGNVEVPMSKLLRELEEKIGGHLF